jgi:hypothetical protein
MTFGLKTVNKGSKGNYVVYTKEVSILEKEVSILEKCKFCRECRENYTLEEYSARLSKTIVSSTKRQSRSKNSI